MAGISDDQREEITSRFPFYTNKLPVRYLGLLLLTKRMIVADYTPLLEKIRNQLNSWTGDLYLTGVGRSYYAL